MSSIRLTCGVAAVGLILLSPLTGFGADYFLTIGGGYSPTGNQISLEKNVLMFRELVAERYPAGVSHDVYFADGNSPGRDLQFADPQKPLPKAHRLLSRVFRQTRYLDYRYRNHQVPGIRGGTSKQSIKQWFQQTGAKLKKGDRLFVYVTAHGGKARDRKNKYNTGLYCWNNQRIAMTEFAACLDSVPADVPVALVMVQCYSGGFAELIFDRGDRKRDMARANRCGFFATVHNRPAAGCTPDINEANYQEYSTYFWDAIRGRTRAGATLKQPDYNGDGVVSFDEAHAYAVLTSTTIDVSVKTSDAFLRRYSRLSHPKVSSRKSTPRKSAPAVARRPRPRLVTTDTPLPELLKLASPAERAIVVGLSQKLKVKGRERGRAARALSAGILKKKKQADAEYRKKLAAFSKAAAAIKTALINRWPELANSLHPRVGMVLQDESADVIRLIESHPRYKTFVTLRKETLALSKRKLDLDREWARCQRLIRTLENIALAANLPKLASPAVVRRYRELLKAEAVSFAPAETVAAPAK